MEREPEQAALAAARDPVGDVEERALDEGPVAHDPDPTGLLGDEDPAAPVAGIGHVEWRPQPADDDAHDRDDAGRIERSGRRARDGRRWGEPAADAEGRSTEGPPGVPDGRAVEA